MKNEKKKREEMQQKQTELRKRIKELQESSKSKKPKAREKNIAIRSRLNGMGENWGKSVDNDEPIWERCVKRVSKTNNEKRCQQRLMECTRKKLC